MIEKGYERVSMERHRPWRWWFMAAADTERGPFLFARGGRAEMEDDCRYWLEESEREAALEREEFLRFRPTHALGAHGELVPLHPGPSSVLDVVEGVAEARGRIGP